MDDDYMELGNTGLVAIENGWLLDTKTGNKIDGEGRVFDSEGELIYEPRDDD